MYSIRSDIVYYRETVFPLPNDTRFQTNTSLSLLLVSSFRVMRMSSSQYVVRITISDDPGATCSNVSPEGKGGADSFNISPNGPSFFSIVLSSGFVLSTFTLNPSNPSTDNTLHLVVIIEVANPPKVATLTRDTNVPVTGCEEDMSIVCVAGPTSLIGGGIASVIPKI